MEQHVNTNKHKTNLERWNRDKQMTLTQMDHPKDEFNKELLNWLVVNNIPVSKIDNKSFTEFLVKYINKPIPSRFTIGRQLDNVFENTMNGIKEQLSDENIWLSVDETTSSDGRCIANVIIGMLKSEENGKSFLVNSVDLDGGVNHSIICTVVDDTIKMIWNGNFKREKFLLLVTDAATYMVKAGKSLKSFYPKLVHITCMAHLINRISCFIRNHYELTDEFIAENKKIFSKCRSRIEKFKSIAPNVSLPPKPIVTRWSTWLGAAFYYAKNFDIIETVINTFDSNDAICIKKAKNHLKNPELKGQLAYLLSNFQFVTEIQTLIQAKNLMLSNAIALIEDFESKLNSVQGSFGEEVKVKFENLIDKNNGFKELKNINTILNGQRLQLNANFTPEQLASFKFAPITSCDVERSFSKYKYLYNQRKHRYEFDNFAKTLIISCNFEN